MKPIRLFIVESDEAQPLVFSEQGVKQLREDGVKESVEQIFGDAGHWASVWLKTATFADHLEIQRRAQAPDEAKGFRLVEGLLPRSRAEVLIERREGRAGQPSAEAFDALPFNVASALDAQILARVTPKVMSNANFMRAWNARE